MSKRVPDFINPFRAAEGGHSIAGSVEFARMSRLIEAIENRGGVAEVTLQFAVDDQGIPHVSGLVRSEVVLICQRCLEPLTLPINLKVELGIVGSDEEASRLPGRYDPLVVDAQSLSIATLIEDEMLLSLPAVPSHEPAACIAAAMQPARDDGVRNESSANPFAVLAGLKTKR